MVKVLSTITIAHLVGLSCSEIFLFLLHPFKLIISASRGALLYYFLVSVAVISIKSSHLFAKRHVPCIFPSCMCEKASSSLYGSLVTVSTNPGKYSWSCFIWLNNLRATCQSWQQRQSVWRFFLSAKTLLGQISKSLKWVLKHERCQYT